MAVGQQRLRHHPADAAGRAGQQHHTLGSSMARIPSLRTRKAYWLAAPHCRVCWRANSGTTRMSAPAHLRHRPHARVSRALDGEGARPRLRAHPDRDRRRPARASRTISPSIRTAACRRSTTTASSCGSRWRSRSTSPRSIRGPALSGNARGRSQGLAMEPVGGATRSTAGSTSGRCTPCACRPQERNRGQRDGGAEGHGAPFRVLDAALRTGLSPRRRIHRRRSQRRGRHQPGDRHGSVGDPASRRVGSGAASTVRPHARQAGCARRPTPPFRSRSPARSRAANRL